MDGSTDDIDKKDTAVDQNTDINFVYNDADEYSVEIAELYSYSEEPEFHINREYFDKYFNKFVSVKWFEASNAERHSHIQRLLDHLESGDRKIRQKATRSLLYLLQGNFGDCELEEDQITWARHNVYLCIECGLLQAITELLLFEIDYDSWAVSSTGSETTNIACNNGSSNKPVSPTTTATPAASTTTTTTDINQNPTVTSTKHSHVTMADSADLRVLLSILYIMVETVRDGMLTDHVQQTGSVDGRNTATNQTSNDAMTKLREQFVEDLAMPIGKDGDLTLTVVLFGMIHRFCSGLDPHFPMKKVLLLLWKVLLITLGPLSSLHIRKNQARARYGLPPITEDSTCVIQRVRATSPPILCISDQVLARMQRNNNNNTNINNSNMSNRNPIINQSNQAPRQGSLAGGRVAFEQQQKQPVVTAVTFPFSADSSKLPVIQHQSSTTAPTTGFDTPRPSSPVSSDHNDHDKGAAFCRDTSEQLLAASSNLNQSNFNHPHQVILPGLSTLYMKEKSLPWKPKVKKKDLEAFLSSVRLKFIGFHVPNDTVSLAGLPEPIHEAVRVMREHLYVSLGEMQIERENEIAQNPLSMSKESIPDTPVERLYRAMYPLLPQYMIALLKVLLAAGPTSRTKTESINILAEMTPEDDIPTEGFEQCIFDSDKKRHREIIVKAISALLLLLLKQFKLNHIYQFEYVSQYLVFANCIPLILKFFNQEITFYVTSANTISYLEFPARLIGEQVEYLTLDMVMGDWISCCWRNMFACINLLRILNMLTKWKHSRIMLLVVFKSAPILKRGLRVRHAMLQLYILKLLKLQSRYFGRQWRKNNMPIMSAIYQKVRHRLTDDWAYGNDVDALPWQFQVEECSLRTNVDQFNQRRYCNHWIDPEYKPVDNCLMSVLSQPVQLSDEFKQNYEKWLEEEVFSVPINWSHVLAR
ncbi:Striatin-interacting protein 1 [Schistosoma japonicum]|nr:Striatin-interacting protein 1 [Schistosoma japonicum]KAH8869773.1 Striatin-interacting protein 1 [Schistosoma japonicum]KAH8869774.1 Striatin-interacting protein 1 [Schistosoma japonicum]